MKETAKENAMAIVAPSDHHEFPPSGLNRLASCPMAYKVCKGWSSPASAASERGTMLHRAVYDDAIYDTLKEADRDAIDYIRANHIAPYPKERGFVHLHEKKLYLRDDDGSEINFGTCDFIMLDPTRTVAMVKDWKFGSIPVPPASKNLQLIDYALSVMQEFPTVTKVFAEIVQPALEGGSEEDPAAANDKVAELSRADMGTYLDAIRLVIQRCKDANPEDPACYSCTPENCRFCNRLNCRVHRERMEQNFALFAVPGEQATAFAGTDEGRMTIDYANDLLLAKKAIEAAMEEKATAATQVVVASGGSGDFRVVEGRVSRRTDWKKVAEEAAIPPEIIEAHTTETVSKPYLMPKQRRQRLPMAVAAALGEPRK